MSLCSSYMFPFHTSNSCEILDNRFESFRIFLWDSPINARQIACLQLQQICVFYEKQIVYELICKYFYIDKITYNSLVQNYKFKKQVLAFRYSKIYFRYMYQDINPVDLYLSTPAQIINLVNRKVFKNSIYNISK